MPEERIQRRLAAILAADVVGYSRMMQADEAGTLAALKARRSEVLQPLVSRHHGRVVKLMGDGVLIEFASAVDAVECAVQLQQGMESANAGLRETLSIQLRIGVNLGDVIVEGSDLYGDGVNIAARLESLADPGSVFVSRTVVNHVRGKVKLEFEDVGDKQLKNIAEPVRTYRIRLAGSAPSAPPRLAPAEKPSIAVLPFVNMSGNPEQEYFSDGITEDIITELSRFHSVLVIARNSTFQFRGKSLDMREVGQKLSARYLVEGSVRGVGNRIRITAQLIEAASGNHLWADRYDREFADVFAVQDEVTRSIVSHLATRLEDEELQIAKRKPPQDMHAYDLCLQAWRSAYLMRGESTNQALLLFRKAIAIDPSFARAYAGLAWTLQDVASYSAYSDSNASISQLRDEALRCGLKAVELDDADSKPHTILGWVYHQRRDFDIARRHLDRAFDLNPNDADGLILRALLLTLAGDATAGITCATQAIRLNPYHPGYYLSVLGACHFFNGNYAEAARAREKVAHGFPEHHASLAAAYALAGEQKKATEALADFLSRASAYWKEPPTARLITDMFVFKRKEDEALYFDGLRKAGLSE
jgi:TolB-like protein